jgi:hypothetical protein
VTAVASRVEAQISGTISGQVAVGNHIIQNNVDHGGVVYIAAPGETPTPRPRPLPVVLRGRRAPDLLGREREVEEALDALQDSTPVEFVGPAGIGKTTLLKYLAHNAPDGVGAHGVVYHEAHGEAPEDSLQFLYEAFYETTVPFKPTEAQLQLALRDVHALVVLDDVDVGRSGTAQILDALPAATFVLAGARRSLWGHGVSVALRGLGPDAAVELLTRELADEVTARERRVAEVIAEAVGRQPLQLLQAAALVTDLGYGLADLADELRRGVGSDELGRLLLESLDDEQRQILEILAVLEGATLPAAQLAALTGVADAGPVLESLMRLGLVQAHSPRYSVAADPAALPAAAGRAPADEAARRYLIGWVEERRERPEAVVEESQAVLAVLRSAARDQAWTDLLRLGRAAEGPFLLARRWGAWREVLEHELTAARRLGDRPAEAWALHQLGSRALCLRDRAQAWSALSGALRIREQLGDNAGSEVTRHNLRLLTSTPDLERPAGRVTAPVAAGVVAPLLGVPFVLLITVLVFVGALAGGLGIWAAGDDAAVPSGRVEPSLTVEPTSVAFGPQAVGTSSEGRPVTVTNNGEDEVAVGSIQLGGDVPGAYTVEGAGCSGAVLASGHACTVSVVFTPTEATAQPATLTFAGRGFEPHVVELTGSGTGPTSGAGALVLQPASVDFGTVLRLTTARRTVTLRNAGTREVRLETITVTGTAAGQFRMARNGCPEALAPGGQCSVEVSFQPSTTTVTAAALLAVRGDGESQSATLQGRALPVVPSTTTTTSVGPPPIDLQVPPSQDVAYGSVLALSTTVRPTMSAALTATGLPAGVGFVDNRDGTGAFGGNVLAAPGSYPVTVTATAGRTVVQERFTLTVVPADVTLRWAQPLLHVSPGSVVLTEAILTPAGGTQPDLTRAALVFEVLPCGTSGTGPVPVDASGRAVLEVSNLATGLYTARAVLAPTPYFRLVSAEPASIVVASPLLGLTVNALYDILGPSSSPPC